MDSAVFSVLPKNYSYVTLVVTSTYQVFLNVYQSIRVNKFRAAAKIPYPQYMAEKAQMDASPEAVRFNCAQRAQANTMENFPHMIFGILFNGLEYPLLSASLGAIWVLGRVLYTYGYHTGDPEARYAYGGLLHVAATFGTIILSSFVSCKYVYTTISVLARPKFMIMDTGQDHPMLIGRRDG